MSERPSVRNTLSWPRSWASFSLLSLFPHMNVWANLHLLGLAPSHLSRFRIADPDADGVLSIGELTVRAGL